MFSNRIILLLTVLVLPILGFSQNTVEFSEKEQQNDETYHAKLELVGVYSEDQLQKLKETLSNCEYIIEWDVRYFGNKANTFIAAQSQLTADYFRSLLLPLKIDIHRNSLIILDPSIAPEIIKHEKTW